MATSLWDLLNKYKVEIPIIQRDYAQGRNTKKISLIRDKILDSLCSTIKKNDDVLELDFIYGYTKTTSNEDDTKQEVFYPLDGQQRLTTLFLLYWFIAVKEGKLEQASKTLALFTYETRHSSRIFCSELVKYMPEDIDIPIKKSIKNQRWFFTAWTNDPTIESMLNMLTAIQEKVEKFELVDVWDRLVSDDAPIVFHLLPTDKLGLPDDLYIKMNSRGKELTDFEYFKVRFSELLKNPYKDKFDQKIDQEWSDLFWDLYKNEEVKNIARKVDNAFLRFFRYITDIIIAKTNMDISEELDEFEIFESVYSIEENVIFIFNILDLFVSNNKFNPNFFSSVFYIDKNDYNISKTRIFFINSDVNLFKKSSVAYDAKQRNNPFSIGEQLLLYACIVHLQQETSDFDDRIRRVRNLVSNSEDTVRKENMNSLLNSVFEIVVSGSLSTDSKFNKTQQNEEIQKEEFIKQNPEMLDTINLLEDHHLLQGCTAIFNFNLQLHKFTRKFYDIFTTDCEYILISRALFTFGDYSQKVSWKRFIGNSNQTTWRDLFTPSIRRGDFQNTKKVLNEFLSTMITDPSLSVQKIIDSYLSLHLSDLSKEKNWHYYFIKYQGFRYHEDGYYYWEDSAKPYESIMMRRKTLGGFHWDPFLLSIKKAFKNGVIMEDNYGKPITYVKDDITLKMTNYNNYFKFEAFDMESKEFLASLQNMGFISSENTYQINQSTIGLDIEDRVLKGIELLEKFNSIYVKTINTYDKT